MQVAMSHTVTICDINFIFYTELQFVYDCMLFKINSSARQSLIGHLIILENDVDLRIVYKFVLLVFTKQILFFLIDRLLNISGVRQRAYFHCELKELKVYSFILYDYLHTVSN